MPDHAMTPPCGRTERTSTDRSARGHAWLQLNGARVAVLCACLCASPCIAQSLDYDDFEELFGEPVTFSATGKPERISDTPVTMDVITADDIRNSGARDLVTLLRTLPGISGYRGYNGNAEFSIGSLFLNGREIYLSSFTEIFLAALPVELDEIRQIEVIRGPQSALYGFNAGEGVINIITYDPAKDPVNNVTLRGGNQARRDGSAILTRTLAPGIGMRLTASSDHAHYDDSGGPTQANLGGNQNPDRRVLAANVSAILDNGDRASIELSHSDISLTGMLPHITQFFNIRLQTDAVKGNYAAETDIGRVSVNAFLTAQTIPQASSQEGGAFTLNDHTIDVRIGDLLKATTEDSIRLEAEFRKEDVHTGSVPGSVATQMLAGSMMWDHQFSPNWSLVNATRYYRTENNETESGLTSGISNYASYGLAYNTSLIDKIGADDSLRAALSRGIALPSPLDFEQLGLSSLLGRTLTIANDPNLSRSSSLEYRVSWDHQFGDHDMLGRVSLFSKQSSNALALLPVQIVASFDPACRIPNPYTAAFCQQISSQSVLSGVFDGAQWQIDHKAAAGVRWGLNYSIERLHPHSDAADKAVVSTLDRSQIYHKVNANLGYGWTNWTADLRLYYSSAVPTLILNTTGLPGVDLVDAKDIVTLSPHLAWSPREDLVIDLAADNLWGYRENLLQRVGPSGFVSVKVKY